MYQYILLFIVGLTLGFGLIHMAATQDSSDPEMVSISDYSIPTVESAPQGSGFSFNYNPNYEHKAEFEEWLNSDGTKVLLIVLILLGSTILTKLSMKNDIIRIALFSGAYYGSTLALVNNMIFISTSNKWCFQFLIEYQILGLLLGLLAGGNAFFMIKYQKQILLTFRRSFSYIWGVFF